VPTSNQRLPKKAKRVLGFLIAKGFLRADDIEPLPNAKIRVKDALWVAEHVEPRVLEVFPAAYLHFPRAFIGHKDLPEEIRRIIQAIRNQQAEMEDYRGIRFEEMVRWANRSLPDRRTKPSHLIRRNKTLRLTPATIEGLRVIAARTGRTETGVVEELVRREAAQP
jgi:hypothetical protein